MNIIQDYLDILQNIEKSILAVANANPEIADGDILLAFEKAVFKLSREKKRLPELPVLMPPKTKKVYDVLMEVVGFRLNRDSDEIVDSEFGYQIPYRHMIPVLERLIKSVKMWTKKDGRKGFINFVSGYA